MSYDDGKGGRHTNLGVEKSDRELQGFRRTTVGVQILSEGSSHREIERVHATGTAQFRYLWQHFSINSWSRTYTDTHRRGGSSEPVAANPVSSVHLQCLASSALRLLPCLSTLNSAPPLPTQVRANEFRSPFPSSPLFILKHCLHSIEAHLRLLRMWSKCFGHYESLLLLFEVRFWDWQF